MLRVVLDVRRIVETSLVRRVGLSNVMNEKIGVFNVGILCVEKV